MADQPRASGARSGPPRSDHPDDRGGAKAGPALSRAQKLAWLRLIRSENVGPVTFRDLVNHFGGAEAALEALPTLSRRGGARRALRIATSAEAEREWRRAEAHGACLVAIGEPGYPEWLAALEAPPPLLYVKGRKALAAEPIVAIVGARNGSAAGQKMARLLAEGLGQAGIVVASGLARGIDGAAHRAALERGTIAVVAGGIDVVYPPEHRRLQAAIAEQGLLISERAPGTVPRGQDFPRRNRIISGISAAVVVVEAARRSGSLITARFALEQGREVFAVPGHPLDPRAAGTNALLRKGASLCTSVDDVIECLAPILDSPPPARAPRFLETLDDGTTDAETVDWSEPLPESDRERVVAALGAAPIEIDELCRATELDSRRVRVVLLELELAGRLERHAQQLVSLRS